MNSLHAAIKLAVKNGLDGIVSKADPLLDAPDLIQYIHAQGLVVCSYGQKNNEVACSKKQKESGIDGLIVDCVRRITSSLRSAADVTSHC